MNTPLIEYIINQTWASKEQSDYVRDLFKMHEAVRPNLVEGCKKLLGKQSYCWTGEFRFWIWKFENCRIFVSNHQGISIELRKDLTKDQVREVWSDLKKKFDLK